jgi:hypothetical protein
MRGFGPVIHDEREKRRGGSRTDPRVARDMHVISSMSLPEDLGQLLLSLCAQCTRYTRSGRPKAQRKQHNHMHPASSACQVFVGTLKACVGPDADLGMFHSALLQTSWFRVMHRLRWSVHCSRCIPRLSRRNSLMSLTITLN